MKRVSSKGLASKTTAWILSAALAFSACPMSAQAEENVEDITSQQTENQKTETDETVENSESGETVEEASDKQEEETPSEDEISSEEVSEENTSEDNEEVTEQESEEDESTEIVSETQTEEETIFEEEVALFAMTGNVTKTCPTIGANGKVTFHYYPEGTEEITEAYVKGSWSGDWSKYFYMTPDENGVWSVTADLSLDDSYQYGIMVNGQWAGDPTNPCNGGNSEILRNPQYNSDGSVSIFYYPQDGENVELLYRTADDSEYKSITMTQDSKHSSLLSATVSEQGDYTYKLKVNGSETADVNCKSTSFSITKLPEEDKTVKSPVVNGNKVTFNYYAPTAKSVSLAGQMNDWSTSATPLTYNAKTGFWSVEKELTPGLYEYKFVVDGSNWVTDPKNDKQSNTNSACYVSGLKADSIDTEAGAEVTLPETLKLFDENGVSTDVKPEYTIEDKYKDILSIKDGKIAVPSDFTAEQFKVIAAYNDETTDICVKVKSNLYTYNIYYFDKKHQDKNSAALWIWTDGVDGKEYTFNSAETLEDGNIWLKAETRVAFENLNIIPKSYNSEKLDWSWQDEKKEFANSDKNKEMTIYLVNGDPNVYTSIPEIVEKESRYVIIEYNRPAKDYEGWNIYSWNTGYGSEVTADFKEIAGKMVAMVPVVDTKESISFCMRRSEDGNPWAEKDGGDHTVAIPLDQKVVKAGFEQGVGVTGNLPYNIGYETNVTKGEITFYYRDDALYQKYEEAALEGKIKLIHDGKEYEMAYDAANERYFYTAKLEAGDHYYGYDIEGTIAIDKFNNETTEVDGKTYSAYKYVTFDAELTANVTPESIDYNDNAVLKLTIDNNTVKKDDTVKTEETNEVTETEETTEADKTNELNKIEVVEAYADLSELGQSSKFAIDPALMEATIAVNENIGTGEKNIPVTVKDKYGNLYETTATVTVVPRDNSNDFDWDEAVIYFAVTDRFFDGNSSNNDAYGTGTYDPSMGSMYHGGDFAGLEAKLDYLQDLGVNTVWITPVVENIETVSECDGYEGQKTSGYHGYWASDFTTLNKHLGTEEEFSALINAMHARGMKLMVDVVLNHAGYGVEDDYNNTYIPGKNMLRDNTTTVKGDDKKDALSGLPDFVTEDREVSDMLIAWQTSWVSKYDIDYFRVDTVKHVDDTTWKAFKNALTYIDPDFKMIGEYAGGGYATNAGQLGTGQMDSILDFDFNDQALSFVNGNLGNVESFMEGRNAGINNTATVGSFLGSHDEDGLMYRMMNESGKFDKDKAYALMKVAATLQITAKGQPVIYYGEELGQTGANNWPYQDNRYDMDWASANSDNDMLTHYTKLLGIRNQYTDVFAKGGRNTVKLDESNGVLVVSRNYGGQALYVGFNVNETEPKQVEVSLNAGTTYTDLYSGDTYTADNDGKVTITIPAAADGGTVILKAGNTVVDEPSVPETPVIPDEPSAPETPVIPDEPSVSETPVIPSEPQISDKTEDNSGKSSNGGSENNAALSQEKVFAQPAYIRIDGTVCYGWRDVIKESVKEAEEKLIPLAASAQTLVADIILADNTLKTVPAADVKTMVESGADFRFHFGKDAVVVFTHNELTKVIGDLDLNLQVSKDKDFGQNFKSLVLDPRKKSIYGLKIAVAFNMGKENAGKAAYIFKRNSETNQVELLTAGMIGADGAIALPDVDYTDIIVLY